MPKRNSENQGSLSSKKRKLGEVGQEDHIVMPEKYADPTFDMTFKMLFGNNEHKDVLISLINSLLGFEGDKEIVEVAIDSNELHIGFFSHEKGQSGIAGSVDVLCTNKGKQKIAIEMQGQRTKYFLAREQVYMSSLIVGQAKEGDGKLYHEKVLETHMIIIGKESVFVGKTALNDSNLFELDVQPMVIQTSEVFPGNKMIWKFFELPKFEQSSNYQSINEDSPLKEQWLEFLIDCSNQQSEPDRNEIIKKGYRIMEVAKWTPDQQSLYFNQKMKEEDLRQTREEERHEAFEMGEIKGKLKGEIKGEISKVKALVDVGASKEKIVSKLKFLTDPKVLENLDNHLDYIREHNDETDSLICENLGLVGALLGLESTDMIDA